MTTITEIVLRDGFWDHSAMSECWATPDSKEQGQILPGHCNQLLGGEKRKLRMAFATDIAGKRQMIGGGTVWKEG